MGWLLINVGNTVEENSSVFSQSECADHKTGGRSVGRLVIDQRKDETCAELFLRMLVNCSFCHKSFYLYFIHVKHNFSSRFLSSWAVHFLICLMSHKQSCVILSLSLTTIESRHHMFVVCYHCF